jgi:hypothetical protein
MNTFLIKVLAGLQNPTSYTAKLCIHVLLIQRTQNIEGICAPQGPGVAYAWIHVNNEPQINK